MNKNILTGLVLAIALSACASKVKKADIAATANPSEEIARLTTEINQGYADQLDVLAAKDIEKAESWLAEAKDDLASGQKNSEVIEDIAYSQSYLDRARANGKDRAAKAPALVENRQRAIDAGARKFGSTKAELAKVDDDVRSYDGRFEKMDADDMAELQRRYLALELNAIKTTQLGDAKAKIEAARDGKAYSYAPAALKRAEVDVKTAEDRVSANRNTPETYEQAVATANQSADLLVAILKATNSGRVDEGTATGLVNKDRKIETLQSKLGDADAQSAQVNAALEQQGKELAKAGAVISMTQALESARTQFTKEEAEVYQQGNKLLIRLKSMNFPSGRSELPSDALPVLAKVRTVAQELGPKEVMIEGHTDSTGNRAKNQELSQERADAIAKYLESNGLSSEQIRTNGFGFSKPIASNKSKAGRAQNRRVDIVITPEAVTGETSAM